ncbi:hypothetical protein JCM10213_007250 [Rhodosporidiobolus nylandii]
MHARIAHTTRAAARTAFTARATVAPTFAAASRPQTRLFRTSPFASSSQTGHIPLPSEPSPATPSNAPKEDPTAHLSGSQEGHIPLEQAAASSSSAAAEPSPSPAPIDNEKATSLPTEEIPAASSSLDASKVSSPTPSQSPAPIDNEASTSLPTEEIPAVSSSLDATQSEAAKAAKAQEDQERVARTVFVGGLSWNVDSDWLEDEVHSLLDRADGVSTIRIARDHMGRSKGFAFVELESAELARSLIGTQPMIDGRQVQFQPSTSLPSDPSKNAKAASPANGGARNPPSNTIWLGNVAWSADEALLERVFRRFGEITRIGQPKDFETGRSRGIAYIEFATVDSAVAAMQFGGERGFRVDGRPVKIDFATTAKRGNNKGRLNSAAGGRGRGPRRQ